MPLEALRWPITPVGLHYLLIHYDVPLVDPAAWQARGRRRGARTRSRSRSTTSGRAPGGRARRRRWSAPGTGGRSSSRGPLSQPWLDRGGRHGALAGRRARGRCSSEAAPGPTRPWSVVFTGLDRGVEGGERAALRAEPGTRRGAGGGRGARLRDERRRRSRRSTAFRSGSSCPGWYGMTNVKWLARDHGSSRSRSTATRSRAPTGSGRPRTRRGGR